MSYAVSVAYKSFKAALYRSLRRCVSSGGSLLSLARSVKMGLEIELIVVLMNVAVSDIIFAILKSILAM